MLEELWVVANWRDNQHSWKQFTSYNIFGYENNEYYNLNIPLMNSPLVVLCFALIFVWNHSMVKCYFCWVMALWEIWSRWKISNLDITSFVLTLTSTTPISGKRLSIRIWKLCLKSKTTKSNTMFPF